MNVFRRILSKIAFKTRCYAAGFRRFSEAVRYSFVFPAKPCRFHIVSAERNAGEFVLKCLDSVYNQKYDRSLFTHVVIDDTSTDGTDTLIENWLETHPGNSVKYIRNAGRVGLCGNNYTGFTMAEPGSIAIELNGDDWLPDPTVLAFLNKVYSNPDVWMTYNTIASAHSPGLRPSLWPHRVPERVIKNNSFRRDEWCASALHSFRMELFAHLKKEDLMDPATGRFWETTADLAYYFPLLELAGRHSRHINRVSYIYNVRESSDEKSNRALQLDTERRIRLMPPYQPIISLAPPARVKNTPEDLSS
jgi:glycosyltransferase involved in cell wall biosynthesis